MANLSDVARLAGVSAATVSRFANGSLVLPQRTADQIRRAIEELHYVPNPHARSLSRGRTDTVGLVVPDIATPFFATFVAAVEEEADRLGLSLALHATLNRQNRELRYLAAIRARHADGLIFVTNRPGDAALAAAINAGGKVILVDEDVPGTTVPKLFCDNEAGGYLAGRHLAEAGHRHVLFVGGDAAMISGRRRLEGARRGLASVAGEAFEVECVTGLYTTACGRRAAQAYLARTPRPTAIFASSDELVTGLLEGLRAAGTRIPDEVSIVGFDDAGPLHLFAPAVTAVRQPVRELGTRALRLLLETVRGDPAPEPVEELLPVTLVERASVAPPNPRTPRSERMIR